MGQTIVTWLSFILSEADHRLSYVEPWVAKQAQTLKRLIDPTLTEQDFSDERLGDVLRYLSDDPSWAAIEREVGQRSIRVYQLPLAYVRLDSTTVSLYHEPEGTELIRYGHSKDHRPDLAQLARPDAVLPPFVADCPLAQKYRTLLGALDWANFPERETQHPWPGFPPLPRAPFVAAYLIKLDQRLRYMSDLRHFLVQHPALIWLAGFPLQPARRPDLVDVAVQVQLQQVGRIVGRLPHFVRAALRMAEAEFHQIECGHEAIDRPHRIVPPDIVLNPGRKEAGLIPALAGLECAIRHNQNRTSTPQNEQFLPSLYR